MWVECFLDYLLGFIKMAVQLERERVSSVRVNIHVIIFVFINIVV